MWKKLLSHSYENHKTSKDAIFSHFWHYLVSDFLQTPLWTYVSKKRELSFNVQFNLFIYFWDILITERHVKQTNKTSWKIKQTIATELKLATSKSGWAVSMTTLLNFVQLFNETLRAKAKWQHLSYAIFLLTQNISRRHLIRSFVICKNAELIY